MGIDLPLIWAAIIAFGIMMYVVMDGFDLGIGILFPFVGSDDERDVMMNTVAPVWDGNETWLVLGGAGLLAAFPLAYSVVLTALYLPITLMVLGLIFRGVAFEFRFKSDRSKGRLWDLAFAGGSYTAAYCQGLTLGAYIEGIPITDGRFDGGPLGWASPFAFFTGFGLLAAYALLGSTWLIMKTEGALQQRMRQLAGRLAWALLAAIAVISIWTPLMRGEIATRWFHLSHILWFAPVPILVLLSMHALRKALRSGAHVSPFLLTLSLIFLGYSGLAISIWPNIIPPAVSIWQAAGPLSSLGFALVGTLLIIPVIVMYTAWGYWVFRGKVRVGDGYH